MAEPRPNRAALLFGVFFIVAGVAFLLERLGIWDFRMKYLAPALLIGLGAVVLLGGRGGPRTGGR
jgi:cell wall-active antibiotic response 4TMS protein YvqF